ncbi:MAG: hypothetical protein JW900_08840 [Anaerolineae bacterium]|nr:hypothetical protein [Anaerolineae bacterium]
MIQSGQITADKGAQLLEALEPARPEPPAPPPTAEPQQIRIIVTDLATGHPKATINMPWRLVGVGVKMGSRFARDTVHMQDVITAIKSGATGKIVDVVDKEDNERVEIFVE